jgi:hypothetical protein
MLKHWLSTLVDAVASSVAHVFGTGICALVEAQLTCCRDGLSGAPLGLLSDPAFHDQRRERGFLGSAEIQ